MRKAACADQLFHYRGKKNVSIETGTLKDSNGYVKHDFWRTHKHHFVSASKSKEYINTNHYKETLKGH